jgi:hypothetical protein
VSSPDLNEAHHNHNNTANKSTATATTPPHKDSEQSLFSRCILKDVPMMTTQNSSNLATSIIINKCSTAESTLIPYGNGMNVSESIERPSLFLNETKDDTGGSSLISPNCPNHSPSPTRFVSASVLTNQHSVASPPHPSQNIVPTNEVNPRAVNRCNKATIVNSFCDANRYVPMIGMNIHYRSPSPNTSPPMSSSSSIINHRCDELFLY